MLSIEEHEEERDGSRSCDSPKSKQLDKLNMAELQEQHKKLKEKINESQRKVLEEGLRRQRRSHNFERQELRKSIQNLEMQEEVQKGMVGKKPSSSQVQTTALSDKPSMDYLKHVLQKKIADR